MWGEVTGYYVQTYADLLNTMQQELSPAHCLIHVHFSALTSEAQWYNQKIAFPYTIKKWRVNSSHSGHGPASGSCKRGNGL